VFFARFVSKNNYILLYLTSSKSPLQAEICFCFDFFGSNFSRNKPPKPKILATSLKRSRTGKRRIIGKRTRRRKNKIYDEKCEEEEEGVYYRRIYISHDF